MKTLKDGIIKFQQNYFNEHKEIFNDLAKGQKPHTLYIGCSDSRVVPNIITKAMPGELFVVRNIGNMVPPFDSDKYQYRCTSSIIEYAVKVLEVDNIVICGHSNCGGCKALYLKDEELDKTPLVKEWLYLAKDVKERILKKNLSYEEREFQTEQLNIVKQLENLLTYPFVKERFENEKLNIVGWYYVIETGDVFNYDLENGEFKLIE